MEKSIRNFTETLASFCNHLQSTCDSLKQSVDRRPIPFDSASSTFIQCLNRRVSSASADLSLLDSMSFGTVSFEELLGHFREVHKMNQTHISDLEDRLKASGYLPELEIDGSDDEVSGSTPSGIVSKLQLTEDKLDPPSVFAGSLEEDILFDDSLNLQSLGLSDACLATLASNANGDIDASKQEPLTCYGSMKNEIQEPCQSLVKVFGTVEDGGISVTAPKSVISISMDDYEKLPSYMRSLASWEDLLTAVEKMNSSLNKKAEGKGSFFHQDELESLDLGVKVKSYLLLLLRMKRLVVETVDGLISYRVL